jgi:hypothetical protein
VSVSVCEYVCVCLAGWLEVDESLEHEIFGRFQFAGDPEPNADFINVSVSV